MVVDVLFLTHASAASGFGHAARCGRIAALLADRDDGLVMAMEGDLSASARAALDRTTPFRTMTPGGKARVGVYDRMDDPEEPETWDAASLDDLRERCGRVVFMANGLQAPAVPTDVVTVGYKPAAVTPQPPRLLWGLEYAPVANGPPATDIEGRDPARAFVALGGASGSDGAERVLAALARVPGISTVDVLLSPVNPANPAPDRLRPDQTLRLHRGVPTLAPFLARAGVVIASYGHLGYEALACGAPLCLVGQKRFQADYAENLAARGLCVATGLLSTTDTEALAGAIGATLEGADGLGQAARAAVDGRGLERIADLILGLLEAP